jgi:hypothetical protein
MRASRFKTCFVSAVVVCGLFAVLLAKIGGPSFSVRLRNLKDGASQAEVKQALGGPTQVGTTACQGAGGLPVIRWEYKRRLHIYRVDFDYIGPAGAPAVFRKESLREWNWPSHWPWRRVRT